MLSGWARTPACRCWEERRVLPSTLVLTLHRALCTAALRPRSDVEVFGFGVVNDEG
jgi:hypothetical protein